MLTADRMAAVDENAAALGVPRKQLMESSGNAVARVVDEHLTPGDRVVAVCGRGNNGGDAFVAARFLDDYDVETVLLGRPRDIGTDIASENWAALEAAELATTTVTDSTAIDDLALDSADCVVDAMLGTGVTGALREPEASAARAINATDATVVAVDVPSGVDADTGDSEGPAVDADHIVTFHEMKPGLPSLDASVTVADIGIPPAAERFVGPGDLPSSRREPTSHKGDHGTVLVVGGGPYAGAPALSAQAALRAGADLIHVATPESVAASVQGYSENLIVHPLAGERLSPATVETVRELAADVDCVVCGPGLGGHSETRAAVASLLESFAGRVVVDADALTAVASVDTGGTVDGVRTDATLICTPHQGELRAMGGETHADRDRRGKLVADFAGDLGCTLLVKGAVDVLSDGETTRHNRTGTPAMTVGGTGDVLAGCVGALFAREPPMVAAAAAAYGTGLAGERAAERYGNGLVATDLLEWLPEALGRTDE